MDLYPKINCLDAEEIVVGIMVILNGNGLGIVDLNVLSKKRWIHCIIFTKNRMKVTFLKDPIQASCI